jgi:hypothetical protein
VSDDLKDRDKLDPPIIREHYIEPPPPTTPEANGDGGDDDTRELLDLYSVLKIAMERFLERDKIYKGLWKDGGWPDSANHIRHKASRIALCKTGMESDEELAAAVDDAIDSINYNAFFILNVISKRNGEGAG